MKNILQYLEKTVEKYPKKICFESPNEQITYENFVEKAKKIGVSIYNKINKNNRPIIVFIDKSIDCIKAMFGILYSGNYYIIMDVKSPEERAKNIIKILNPEMIITNKKNNEKIKKMNISTDICLIENLENTIIQNDILENIRKKMIDTDPMYILFTSGSTGIPKGTVVSHKSVISYIQSIINTFDITNNTVFASQTQFYFSMSVLDLYSTIIVGATLCLIPKMYFSFPIKLLEYIEQKKVNTIYWVPSALSIIANLKALNNIKLQYLNKILFAGEVMPTKILNYWIYNLPNAMYANLYGPTEVTDICTYYIVDRKLKNTEPVPIGKSCDNCDVIIIKDDNTEANVDEKGELFVRGSFLASGYYNCFETTQKVFIQNPLNKNYPEIVYKTGDIVKKNKNGEILYICRKDFQIKHMGYRIELGEIETVLYSIENIESCVVLYNEKKDEIVMFYVGNQILEEKLLKEINEKLLYYMRPNIIKKLEKMPYNANGKIDRNILKKEII